MNNCLSFIFLLSVCLVYVRTAPIPTETSIEDNLSGNGSNEVITTELYDQDYMETGDGDSQQRTRKHLELKGDDFEPVPVRSGSKRGQKRDESESDKKLDESGRSERRKGMSPQEMPKYGSAHTTTSTTTESPVDFKEPDEEYQGLFTELDDKDQQEEEEEDIQHKISSNSKSGSHPGPPSKLNVSNIKDHAVIIGHKDKSKQHISFQELSELGSNEESIHYMKRPMNIWGTKNIIIFNSKIYCRTNTILD